MASRWYVLHIRTENLLFRIHFFLATLRQSTPCAIANSYSNLVSLFSELSSFSRIMEFHSPRNMKPHFSRGTMLQNPEENKTLCRGDSVVDVLDLHLKLIDLPALHVPPVIWHQLILNVPARNLSKPTPNLTDEQ